MSTTRRTTKKTNRRIIVKPVEPITQKVPLRITGFTGDLYDLIRAFACSARAIGITQDQISAVIAEIPFGSDDYQSTARVIAKYVDDQPANPINSDSVEV